MGQISLPSPPINQGLRKSIPERNYKDCKSCGAPKKKEVCDHCGRKDNS